MHSSAQCRDYHHPYEPYEIQVQFMDELYDTLENEFKIGLFESPTGTGKTLSIICSAMTWLRDYKRNRRIGAEISNGNDASSDDDEPEWVQTAYRQSVVDKTKTRLKEFEGHLDQVDENFRNKKRSENELPLYKKHRRKHQETEDLDSFLPVDYESDSFVKNNVESGNSKLRHEISMLMKKASSNDELKRDFSSDSPIKIYFSSRTHSQLNQFSSQLQLTSFDASFEDVQERTKYIPLGSRKQLCINEEVTSSKKREQSINDACIDLQKTKNGCRYLNNGLSIQAQELVDLSLARIRDIEELGELGSQLHICPYYSVRPGIKSAEIISLPYQLLLQSGSRESWNLQITDSIVIIDEAHNIFDALTSLYSVKITVEQLSRAIQALKTYMSKFSKRLNSGNRINLMKLIKVCKLMIEFMQKNQVSAKAGCEIKVEDIFKDSTGDLVNIHKIDQYLTRSKIAFKLESYMEKIDNDNSNPSSPVLFDIIQFLKSLTNPAKEGKFFWDNKKGEQGEEEKAMSLNYMLLDPSTVFKEIVDQAKCVILCGGTMEPMTDFTDYLFPFVPSNQIKKFSCGHIIPAENLKVIPVDSFNGGSFEFSYAQRQDEQQRKNLGEFIIKISEIVPFGIVVFFSSYKVLNEMIQVWKSSTIYSRLSQLKQIFFEESTTSSKVEAIMSRYSHVINTQRKGAILLAVVGGKLSEGINFSNDLARAEDQSDTQKIML
ncbi:CHL1 [Candida oxycetoniae]|uniref:ATP-dependent DNA helicase CHL1 n=1 Tax=Candida oxycetoniae TaxID=497107 RepID=A0AAI9WX82_9ASCO|nr:CHL1 [Candida oxycetoniae]KAI3403729.2 CHL1 [Candida oxycetoniae]